MLDEADHMADLGFLPGVTRILAATPQGGQRMMFSATLDRGVDTLVRRFLHDEVRHEVDESSVPQGVMTHRVFVVGGTDEKTALVRHLASGRGRRILFTRTKHQAKKLAKQLTASGIPAVDLHGNLAERARAQPRRSSAPTDKGGVRVLVATDVAARGVHVDDVELVVHVDPPVEHKAYLHRSGRTARAGAEGVVVTVAPRLAARRGQGPAAQGPVTAPLEPVTAGHAAVAELVGEPAAHVTPVAQPVQSQQRPARGPAAAVRPTAARRRTGAVAHVADRVAVPVRAARSGRLRSGQRRRCGFAAAPPLRPAGRHAPAGFGREAPRSVERGRRVERRREAALHDRQHGRRHPAFGTHAAPRARLSPRIPPRSSG